MSRNLVDQPTLLLLFLVVIPFVVFLSALVDILRRQGIDGVTRLTWVLVVLVLPLVGAVLWFVLRSRFGTAPTPTG